MLGFDEARANLLARAKVVQAERLALTEAAGRVLAQDLVSAIAVPPADNSAMDGYAVRVTDLVRDAVLPVSQRVPAGSVPAPLAAGTVARIFTGAPIPPGADAVVMQERAEVLEAGVRFEHLPASGDNIRRAGEDIAPGQVVLRAGDRLDAAALGLAASLGVAELEVFRPLRVVSFFTGDELVAPGQPLAAGQIYNSNQFMLAALLEELGCVHRTLGIVPDDLEATRAALREAATSADLILTCGGVSVGEEDHVKAALEAEGALESWRIAMRPGKPLASGNVNGVPFVGLPGNPVSALVTFQMIVRPFVRRMQGMQQVLPRSLRMRADFGWPKRVPVREFLRVRVNAQGGLDRFASQGSAVLSSCAWADGLVSNPPETAIAEGDMVEFIPFAALP